MNIGKKIEKRRQELGLSQMQLAIKTGYKSRSSINKIELGINDIPRTKIEVFAKALCVDPTFFVVDNMDISENYVKTSIKKMPVIGKIAAGYGGAAVEEHTGEYELVPTELFGGLPEEEFFVLRVVGDSMYPKLLDGDKVLVQRTSSVNTNHTIHIKEGGYLSPSLFAVIHLYALVASALTELKYATAATFELL